MKNKHILFLYLFIYFIFLIFISKDIYISPREAVIFYEDRSLIHYIINFTTSIFGKNEIGLRIFFILSNIANILLLYDISKKILKKESDVLLSAIIFSLLPGFISSSLIISEAPIIIFFTLLFLYFYIKLKKIAYILFPIMLFIDNSFAIFFLSLFFYSLYKKDNLTIIVSLLFFTLSMYIYGFDVSGKPKNYFLDIFGIYSAIFSPFVFIYFFYTLYRILIKEEKNIIWFISFVSFVFSLLLSFRQKIYIEDFAPFVLIGIVLMIKVFLSSYRVRIPVYRKKHKILFLFVLITLIFNDLVLVFNKPLYLFIKNPKKHFAYKYHISKILAQNLKKLGINCVKTDDKKLLYQLKFYGICNNSKYLLTKKKIDPNSIKVSIRYKDIILKDYYVSKINKK